MRVESFSWPASFTQSNRLSGFARNRAFGRYRYVRTCATHNKPRDCLIAPVAFDRSQRLFHPTACERLLLRHTEREVDIPRPPHANTESAVRGEKSIVENINRHTVHVVVDFFDLRVADRD